MYKLDKSIWDDASNIRAELKLVLTQALLGDSLAAEYLLFYLVSTMYVYLMLNTKKKCTFDFHTNTVIICIYYTQYFNIVIIDNPI